MAIDTESTPAIAASTALDASENIRSRRPGTSNAWRSSTQMNTSARGVCTSETLWPCELAHRAQELREREEQPDRQQGLEQPAGSTPGEVREQEAEREADEHDSPQRRAAAPCVERGPRRATTATRTATRSATPSSGTGLGLERFMDRSDLRRRRAHRHHRRGHARHRGGRRRHRGGSRVPRAHRRRPARAVDPRRRSSRPGR